MASFGWIQQVVGWGLFALGLVITRTATREAHGRKSERRIVSDMILFGILGPANVVILLRHTLPGRVAGAVTVMMAVRLLWVSQRSLRRIKTAELVD